MTTTPVEIDTALALLDGKLTSAYNDLVRANVSLRRYPNDSYYAERLAKTQAKVAAIKAEMAPLNEAYTGWTRAFVVADGHVHRSMHCSTCNNGQYMTSFGWVTEFSGKTEAEVIEAAGSRACTMCYPDAPVDAPAGRIFHATEVAAQAAREVLAARKAEIAAKKAANAIPTTHVKGERLETVHAAKAFLTDGFSWGWDHPSYNVADRDVVALILAAKLGTTAEAQVEAAAKRAANR